MQDLEYTDKIQGSLVTVMIVTALAHHDLFMCKEKNESSGSSNSRV